MCGINLAFREQTVKGMNLRLSHRGIRSTVTHLNDNLFLGHVRLPIQGLDPSQDHPKQYRNLTGAFVGEIFNFKEINPRESSDLPVILQQFYIQGKKAFRSFDGFWSPIIYDQYQNKVWIYTDYLAKKPLYIRHRPFGISSEIKALVPLDKVSWNSLYFASVEKWGYAPFEMTPFKEIQKIPANTEICVDLNVRKVFSRKYDKIVPTRGNTIDLLRQSVKNRLVSDVPVSILMSGGLDSTMIYYLAREFMDSLTIFHVENDEEEWLNFIDFRPTDKIIKIRIDENDYNLKDILCYNDGPVDLGSMVPQYLLAREINRHGFKVCLSGDGADELFGGYQRQEDYDAQYSDIFHELIYYHLPRLDKMMMAWMVELRCPFLALPVIQDALKVTYQSRIKKYYLKYIASKIGVPEKIIHRKKQPLRYNNYSKDKREWSRKCIKTFKEIYRNECK